jgi:hypothetical protein
MHMMYVVLSHVDMGATMVVVDIALEAFTYSHTHRSAHT